MEDLLLQIVKECSGLMGSSSATAKHAQLKTICTEVHDFLEAQQGSLRAPPHELRDRCLMVLKMALESKSSKLVSLAVVGFQKLLRDDRFHSRLECESESEWLPTQLLSSLTSLSIQPDDVQLDLLKVLLNMAAACTSTVPLSASTDSSPWNLNEPGVILRVLDICRGAHVRQSSSSSVKIAARAVAGQTLRAFCDHLADEESAMMANPYCSNFCQDRDEEDGIKDSAFDKVVTVLHDLCQKLQQRPQNNNPKERLIQFNLECVLAVVSSLSSSASRALTLRNHLWQELCPTLLSLLGTPTTETTIGVVADGHLASVKQSTIKKCPSVLTATEIKVVYGICQELVNLVGLVGNLRPMLESMFHRILLTSSAVQRLEALRSTKEIMKKDERLLSFAGPPLIVVKKESCSTDLGLLKLAMDAFVECSDCPDNRVCNASVECVVALLDTLERICQGHGINTVMVTRINNLFEDLESADYKGPMTYQTWEKLHKLVPTVKQHQEHENSELGTHDAVSQCFDDTNLEDESVNVNEKGNAIDGEDDVDRVDANHSELVGSEELIHNVDTLSGYETDSSGSTEGPEEGYDDDEHESVLTNGDVKGTCGSNNIDRRRKFPLTLLGDDDGRAEQERVARLYETRETYSKLERCNARHFVDTLLKVLPTWLRIKSSIEADELMQEFASNYCREVITAQQSSNDNLIHRMIINADGVYLAMYTSLLLNLKLILGGYYDEECLDPPLTEEEFVDNVHGGGVLVYLSADWLAELYQRVLTDNFLVTAGYDRTSNDSSALINLLNDMEGTNGAHLLSDYYRLEKKVINEDDGLDMNAGRKFARRVLTGFWDDILTVLRAPLRDKHDSGILSNNIGLLFGNGAEARLSKTDKKGRGEAIAASLEGLQKAARLSSIVDMHSRCESVFSMLSTASCLPVVPANNQHQQTSTQRRRLKASVMALSKRKPIKLHVSHVLSVDVMLSRGLELGSHCPNCWKHVFKCCFYLAELEHSFFSRGISGIDLATAGSTFMSRKTGLGPSSRPSKLQDLDFNEEEISAPTISFPGSAPLLSVIDIMKESGSTISADGILTETQSARVLCSLSQQTDRLFDDAAYKLNMKSLLSFLTELCSESQTVLFTNSTGVSTTAAFSSSNNRSTLECHRDYHGNTLLLYRLGDVMLKCIRSGRPLVHVMLAWSIVGLHLMEAACHSDQDVAKRAVTCIHDIVSSLLATQTELPYFHFNEALFKPFENLLCLEMCDIDIQDQIISSICEFVEGSKTEIRSGWRPLFGALRAVRPHRPTLPPLPSSPKNINQTKTTKSDGASSFMIQTEINHTPGHLNGRHVVLDVFDAFLNAEENNALVFANAAVDCILCLLKHIQGSTLDEESPVDDVVGNNGQNQNQRRLSSFVKSDLCIPSLKYIHMCCQTLASMHMMPSCPIFHASNRIQLGSVTQSVDPVIPGLNLVIYDKEEGDAQGNDSHCINSYTKETSLVEVPVTLDELELPSGILHVWCLILEGLVGATANCPRRHQPDAVNALFSILKKIYELPGVDFGLYVVNHILLPMMQSWLRRASKFQLRSKMDGFATNFKQCCGQTTDLVVDYLTKLADSGKLNSARGARGGRFLLHQLFLLMTECVAQPNESISRLGCSCIRHVIVTSGPLLTPELWSVTVTALRRTSDVSLFHVKQLMAAFKQDSDNFYGDLCQLKVAAKSDCSSQENERLKQLAQQVFLLDNQRSTQSNGSVLLDDPIDDDKSYLFLLYSMVTTSEPNETSEHTSIVKVPFRSMVVGLVSHQLLLQIIGILLSSATHVVPSLANILLQSRAPTPTSSNQKPINIKHVELPGMMRYLSGQQISRLLDCLKDSYDVSCRFDSRPGLKFLVQKVARASVAANLYKQSGASWTLRAVTLLELCLYKFQKTTNTSTKHELNDLASKLQLLDTCFDELRMTFDEICSSYVEYFTSAKKDDEDRFARLQDQPIFFLIAHDVEDYMEARRKLSTDQVEFGSSTDEQIHSPREEHSSERPKDAPLSSLESPPETGHDALLDGFQASEESDDTDDDDNEDVEFDREKPDEEEEEADTKTQVYEVATKKDIDSMVNEYKKRKRQCSMPPQSFFASSNKDRVQTKDSNGVQRRSSVSRAETKLPSVLKDHQAAIKVCTEMLLSMFDFFCQMNDEQFVALLPITFPFVRTLVAHGNDPTLKQTLAEFLDRIARVYGFINTNGGPIPYGGNGVNKTVK